MMKAREGPKKKNAVFIWGIATAEAERPSAKNCRIVTKIRKTYRTAYGTATLIVNVYGFNGYRAYRLGKKLEF
jgi:hypothetical protein